MEIARRAAATARLEDDYRLPDPSPTHGQMSLDALRRELAEETIRQEIIAAELAEQRKLESEVLRELALEHAGPLSLCARAELQLTTLPHHDAFPVRQEGLLHLRMPMFPESCLEEGRMPMFPESCLEEGLLMPGGMPVPRRSVKDRIDEWYRPPWHRLSANEDALIEWARLPKKTFSGMKRRRTDETSKSNNKRSSEKWICDLCHVNTSGEISFVEHCAGYLHQSNVQDMEWAMETAEPTMIARAELYLGIHHKPNAWNCSICQVKCSGELDLKNHLNGRRHQENLGALWRESEENEGESGSQEANLYEKKELQLVDMNQRPTSRWTCSICQANCTSESDLENHLRGRRHQQNVKAQLVEGNRTTVAAHLSGKT